MQDDPVILSLLSVFALSSFFVTLLVKKFFSSSNKLLIDSDFSKPQAFHNRPTARCGGLSSALSLMLFFILYYFFFNSVLLEYSIISLSLFLIGFLDDLKINVSPKIRLILMIGVLSLVIFSLSIKLTSVDLIFLDKWLSNNLFHTFFVLLCFLFIINGANLIDGFNGLLGIHLLIINFILLIINTDNQENEMILLIAAQIIILASFLFFNFPKAQIFLGDGGSYLFGALSALNIIKTNNLHPEISSFFFCILLFYLFFEVFFSFFRKIYKKKSPLKPDNEHLHMLSYKMLYNLGKFKNCNYLNSIIINLTYTLLVFPAYYFRENGLVCKYWFFCLLIIYLATYFKLHNIDKN
jgi:UDP-GlcNAc:undecaprenyl-phosphate/decaprenyl-phosphate GlcNAc-1-phosphate transferase